MKYATLLVIFFSTTALAQVVKPAPTVPAETVPGCPANYMCLTPEQLQAVIDQQILQMRLNEASNNPEVKKVMQQYQDLLSKRKPETLLEKK